jgi:hypothetical protein
MAADMREGALVVTSDREVAGYAESCGADAVDSPSFEARIGMAAATTADDADEGQDRGWKPTTRKKGPSRKLSKKARRRKKKLRKL